MHLNLCLFALGLVTIKSVSAGTFLAPSLESVAQRVDPGLLHKLVAEVEGALGGNLRNGTKETLAEMEDMLRPTYKSMAKNEHGRLDHASVRYVLHRLFVQRHGWVIRGFQQDVVNDAAWSNNSLASQLLHNRVPALVQEIFEARIGELGANLHDIAVLAGLFEHLIHDDMQVLLKSVYNLDGLSAEEPVDAVKADYIVNLYMMFFIQGHTDVEDFEHEQVREFMEHFPSMYPAWPQTHAMLDQVKADANFGQETSFRFDEIAKMLEEASHLYYKLVHHGECQHTKDMLLEIEEEAGNGRVKLLDFYRAAIYDNKHQFTETIEYLRQIGSLDESEPTVPRIIVPNYVSGQNNCVARTGYYAVCCPDECENLMDNLEHALSKPDATPKEILAVVDDGRPLSQQAVRRLSDIAAHHSGLVPLHGRLFAQWMHFVHPQACVYPHPSGTAYTKTMEEWEEETGQFAGSTLDEISLWEKQLHEQHPAAGQRVGQAMDMWTMEEELLVARPTPLPAADSRGSSSGVYFKAALFLAVAAAAAAWVGCGGGGGDLKQSSRRLKAAKYEV